jgi:CysZ protein
MLAAAFSRAFAQALEPEFRKVAIKGIAIAGAAFVSLLALAQWGLARLVEFDVAWLERLAEFAGFGALLVALFLLFPAVVALSVGFFLDEVAAAVERRWYPGDSPGRELPVPMALREGAAFGALALALNLLALPLYLALLFLPPLNLFLFYGLNGYLLGREYFGLASRRHLSAAESVALRKANAGRVFLAGAAIAVLASVPVINFAAPIVGAAAMTHLFKQVARRRSGARPS